MYTVDGDKLIFQSTHPRGVRLPFGSPLLIILSISIHAPTRGATLVEDIIEATDEDFNPRTHEGCDKLIDKVRQSVDNFNPRTHEGCDCIF